VGSIRAECLDRVIIFGERRLRHALSEFLVHYHGERNHQGLGNDLIAPTSGERFPRQFVAATLGALVALLLLRAVSEDEFSDDTAG
jgi:hypothetical protein